ncbi:hypothetical protein J2X07_000485 [Fictibacillus barbaricus]|uniref:Uncharacterized protein n=1 Tax=Fictibacillus barbaricus TaxID=182136 RepID=A0ABU1TWF5_9BACL|nr:hypothetical protein [Fictibacillus barbaricus]
MQNQQVKVRLRDLLIDDANDRYQWCLDEEVTKHLNMPEKNPSF